MALTNQHSIFQVFKQLEQNQEQADDVPDPETIQRIETRIQERVNAGYTVPVGWLFRGLKFHFYSNGNQPDESASREIRREDQRLQFARNTARFAAAEIANTLKSSGITHVIVDPETVSSADKTSLRNTLAAKPGAKMPHLVSVGWVEECWKNGTLLDEESKL
jgi:DNA ligase-4